MNFCLVSPALTECEDTQERRRVADALQQWLDLTLPRQCNLPGDDNGAFADSETGWFDGRHSAYTLASLMAARCWERDLQIDIDRLDDSITRAVQFILRRQHPDGRIDLNGGFSPNEVGFTLAGLATGYSRLIHCPGLVEARQGLKEYLLRGAEAVLNGSAHTANHRWAAAGAPLAAVNRLWPDRRYIEKIEDYLSDGIDCDPDGCWYIERSPNYNIVANEGLIIMADQLGRPELLEYVIRNLKFVLHMLHPNGEMDATISHRQDRNAVHCLPSSYLVARRVAQHTGDGCFTTLAELVWKANGGLRPSLIPLAFDLDDNPAPLPPAEPLPDAYECFFPGPRLLRVRKAETSLSLSADGEDHFFNTVRDQWGGSRHSDDWFHLHHGSAVIQSIHLAGAGMSNIQPEFLEIRPQSWRLGGLAKGWWHPLHFRPGKPVIEMRWDWMHNIAVEWAESGIALRLESTTPHSLYAVLRLWLRPMTIEEDGCAIPIRAGEEFWAKGGNDIVLRHGRNAIHIKGLPTSCHRQQIRHPQPIPSDIEKHCGSLNIGLRFPIAFTLLFIPGTV